MRTTHTTINPLVGIAALVIILAGIQAAQTVLVPMLLALFIALICLPPMHWLMSFRIPASLAILMITLMLLMVGFLVAAFVGASLADFSNNLPFYQQRLQELTSNLFLWLAGVGLNIETKGALSTLDPSAAMSFAKQLLTGLGNALTNTFLIILTVIFLLVEAIALPHKWHAMGSYAPSTDQFGKFTASVHSYLAIKGWVSLSTGVVITVWLTILGVDYPLLWGMIAFMFNFVPNIGSIIAAIPAVLLALVQFGMGTALATAAGYIVVNIVMGNVVEPRFMGKGVGLSTLVVFLSLVFWGWLLGPVGMLLSVPLTMVLKLACETYENLHWVAVLLGPDIDVVEEEITTS
ncbi:MAG: AI-2E family transporter [Mariprofundaceae bacterium]